MAQEEDSRRALIEREAAQWLERLETGSADRAAFERWRDADPAHAVAFAQLDAAWSRLDRVRALRPPGEPDPDLLAPIEPAPSRRWLLRAAAAAGVTILGVGGAALMMTGRASAETGVGERRAVRLPDGSLIDLNTDSRASWRFTDTARQVWLERGEAALEIAADSAARPFVLAAAGRTLALDRGVFNARLRGREAEIVALTTEGSDASPATVLSEGQAVVISAAAERVETLTPAAADAAAAWRRGEIVFDGDTLEEAVAEYNRYLVAKIEIADPAIAELRMGGRFTTRDPEAFLQAAEQAFGIRATRAADGRVLLLDAP